MVEWTFQSAPAAAPRDPPIMDELIPGRWGHFVLQMSNQFHSPTNLAYRRAQYGEDARIKYMIQFLDVRRQRVLELGPLDGYHSAILEKMAVAELISVEAREMNLIRCNRNKQKYRLDHTTFLQQDIERIYQGHESARFSGPFDLVFCAGFLYHVANPAQALRWMRSQSASLFLCTHVFDPTSAYLYENHRPGQLQERGRLYEGVIYEERGVQDPLSGMSAESFWPTEEALRRMIADAGYRQMHVLGRENVQTWPHVTILAKS